MVALYEILSIFPPKLSNLRLHSRKKIDVELSRKVDLDSLINSEADAHKVCLLRNKADNSTVINPYDVMITDQSTLSLYFKFDNSKVQQGGELCFSLVCSTQFTIGMEMFKANQIDTSYCFMEQEKQIIQDKNKCNPNAMAKVVDDKCVCSYPY